jgi:fructan beta-fructosidase
MPITPALLLGAMILMSNSQVTAHRGPEDLRPQFHFTAPKGWLNDPNGLVYHKGVYHLYYQHNPYGTEWGNMTWGHATSKDLIHWEHLANALEPDKLGTMFSGSAVIDKANTAGFGKSAMVYFYTAAGGTSTLSTGQPFTQCLAWSKDGSSLEKLANNPIVGHIEGENRDPHVFWHAPSSQWVMALYLADDRFALLGSKNLKDWKELSRLTLPGASECPNMFELPLDGDKHQPKWIFWGANGDYLVGSFDGRTFHPETETLKSKFGTTGYAAQIYSNAPRGRQIQITWLNNSNFPDCAWNQQLGFPNVLGLQSTSAGPRLTFSPVREIQSIRTGRLKFESGKAESSTGLIDFSGKWVVPASGTLKLRLNGQMISVDAATGIIRAFGSEFSVDLKSGILDLRILVDRTSLEVYAQQGLYQANYFFVPEPGTRRGIEVEKEGTWSGRVTAFDLRP